MLFRHNNLSVSYFCLCLVDCIAWGEPRPVRARLALENIEMYRKHRNSVFARPPGRIDIVRII